jgi:hypothetical protein
MPSIIQWVEGGDATEAGLTTPFERRMPLLVPQYP